jgi:hypothetical protein
LPGDHLIARADAEQPVRQRHRLAAKLRRQKRSGIEVARLLDLPRHQHARKRLARRQLQVRVVLVVAQQDVVLRRPLLDQIVLERERLHYRVGDDHLNRRDVVEERVVPRAEPVRTEIAADAVAQRARLADVDGLPRRIRPQIHAGLLGQAADLFLEITDGHGRPLRV